MLRYPRPQQTPPPTRKSTFRPTHQTSFRPRVYAPSGTLSTPSSMPCTTLSSSFSTSPGFSGSMISWFSALASDACGVSSTKAYVHPRPTTARTEQQMKTVRMPWMSVIVWLVELNQPGSGLDRSIAACPHLVDVSPGAGLGTLATRTEHVGNHDEQVAPQGGAGLGCVKTGKGLRWSVVSKRAFGQLFSVQKHNSRDASGLTDLAERGGDAVASGTGLRGEDLGRDLCIVGGVVVVVCGGEDQCRRRKGSPSFNPSIRRIDPPKSVNQSTKPISQSEKQARTHDEGGSIGTEIVEVKRESFWV
jgi:hypothetical protein